MTPSNLAPQRFIRAMLLIAGLALSLLVSNAAWADPPGRIGRVAEVQGPVWLYSPDVGDWVPAELNRPLTSGDRLSTERGARAELNVGSTTLRIDGGTELEMLQLDDSRMAFQLHGGTVAVTLRNPESAAQFEIRTDQGSFLTQAPGHYRFDQIADASHATVYAGQALYEGPGSALPITPGQRAEFWLTSPTSAEYSLTQPVSDGFAAWDGERERYESRAVVTRYVSPEMTGVDDLNAYGSWEQTPDDGTLWIPNDVPAGWVPYGAGHWTWMSPWGWTWVDDMRWGFAPFHYGRWVLHRNRWGWAPGAYAARPVYAPALVGWVGGPRGGPGFGGDRGGPPVGWFPLAPREVYVPPYRVSANYVRNVNISHVTHITNLNMIVSQPERAWEHADFRNRRLPQAVTTVPGSVFAGHQPVAPAAERWRDSPQGREHAAPGGRNGPAAAQNVTLVAPPVAVPSPRAPGSGQAAGRPGFDPRHAGVPTAPGHVDPTGPAMRPADRGGPERSVPGGRPNFGAPGGAPVAQPQAPMQAPAVPPQAQGQDRRGFQGEPRGTPRPANPAEFARPAVPAPAPAAVQPAAPQVPPTARGFEGGRREGPGQGVAVQPQAQAQSQPQQQAQPPAPATPPQAQPAQRFVSPRAAERDPEQQRPQRNIEMERQVQQRNQALEQQQRQQQVQMQQSQQQQMQQQQMQQREAMQLRQQQMQQRPEPVAAPQAMPARAAPPPMPAAPPPQVHAAPPAPPAAPAPPRPDERMRPQPERRGDERSR